jgi:hypothetical protein
MKRVLLLGLVLVLGLAVVAQVHHLRSDLRQYKNIDVKTMSADPVNNVQASPVVTPLPNTNKSADVVTVLTLGTSANGLGWGYNGDKKTHLWANDTLQTIVQIHRMGPGAAPPMLSGYLAGDHAGNMGLTLADWSINWQIYAATLNLGGTYYADAGRYPNGAIYNPPGNTDPNNSFIVYHAPNFLNPDQSSAVWGGYSHGSVVWNNEGDSAKILDWYTPPPKRYIPDGFTVTHKGISFVTDVEYDQGAVVYDQALLFGYGTWNSSNPDKQYYDYTYSSIPLTAEAAITRPRTPRIAADPSGDIVWIACIDDNDGVTRIDSGYFYPVLFKSTDGGQTWSPPIAIQLYGPTGIPAIENFAPQGKLDSLWSPPGAPPRDQISYTTWGNLDLVVDKWGRPHVVCAIGVGGSTAYSFVTSDSCWGIFDVFPVDKYVTAGTDWCARQLGAPKQFQGMFPSSTYYDDNRPSAASNETGDHVFFTWLDTTDPTATSNSAPDIFARGWNLLTNKLTNANGKDDANNATYLSDVTQAAAAGDAAHTVFTKSDGSHIIPMMCESLTGNDYSQPVTFKYISNFTYPDNAATYSILASSGLGGSPCVAPLAINDTKAMTSLSANIYPNPVHGIATLKVNAPQSGSLTIEVTNLVGQKLMNLNKGVVDSGDHTFNLDATQLTSGVYFYTVKMNNQKVTGKMIVE